MWSFLTGLALAVVLAGGTYWAMEAGTITMVERSDDVSTVIGDVWQEGGWFRDPEHLQPDGT